MRVSRIGMIGFNDALKGKTGNRAYLIIDGFIPSCSGSFLEWRSTSSLVYLSSTSTFLLSYFEKSSSSLMEFICFSIGSYSLKESYGSSEGSYDDLVGSSVVSKESSSSNGSFSEIKRYNGIGPSRIWVSLGSRECGTT